PDANTILISTGGVDTRHDTGVLRFENRTSVPMIIDPGLQVTTEQGVFQLWDSFLPITLTPGQNLVLAETAIEQENFDTSDFGLGSAPVVSGSVNGQAFSFTDTARVLLGRNEAGARGLNETTPYEVLGMIEAENSTVGGPGLRKRAPSQSRIEAPRAPSQSRIEAPRGEGKGIIRVFVSDGLNTAFADVSKLTPAAAQFPPPAQ